MALNKVDLRESIYKHCGCSKTKSTKLVESLLEIIEKTIEDGEDVLISGFGKFCVKDKNERRGRNLYTGNDVILDARTVVTFKCFYKAMIISALIVGVPSNSLACGTCADHSIDWIAPFILPMFPVAVSYLLTRRILYWLKFLPETVPSPKALYFVAMVASVVALFFMSMGSLWVVMFFILIVALQNYIRSWFNVWRKSRLPFNLQPSKAFQWIFLVLWITSVVGTIFWTNSSNRMMFHLSYRSPVYSRIRESYASKVDRYQKKIKAELEDACDGGKKVKPFQLSGIFFLSARLKDSSIAPYIAKLLINHAGKKDLYFNRFFEEGLTSLASLDKVILINTCKTLLNANQFLGKNVKEIDYEYGKRLSLILSMLIENGNRTDYERFITKDNIEIMLKYRTIRYSKRYETHVREGDQYIGLEGLDLDLKSFGIDPAIMGR